MATIKIVFITIIKALIYGIGLATGFWIAGYVTNNIQYYFEAYANGHWNDMIEGKNITYKQRFMTEWWVKPFVISKVEPGAGASEASDPNSTNTNNPNTSNNNPTTDKNNTTVIDYLKTNSN